MERARCSGGVQGSEERRLGRLRGSDGGDDGGGVDMLDLRRRRTDDGVADWTGWDGVAGDGGESAVGGEGGGGEGGADGQGGRGGSERRST